MSRIEGPLRSAAEATAIAAVIGGLAMSASPAQGAETPNTAIASGQGINRTGSMPSQANPEQFGFINRQQGTHFEVELTATPGPTTLGTEGLIVDLTPTGDATPTSADATPAAPTATAEATATTAEKPVMTFDEVKNDPRWNTAFEVGGKTHSEKGYLPILPQTGVDVGGKSVRFLYSLSLSGDPAKLGDVAFFGNGKRDDGSDAAYSRGIAKREGPDWVLRQQVGKATNGANELARFKADPALGTTATFDIQLDPDHMNGTFGPAGNPDIVIHFKAGAPLFADKAYGALASEGGTTTNLDLLRVSTR